jgi:hypothetical protein
MTLAQILAALDTRYSEHMAAEVARMRREGVGEAVISAIVKENDHRFAAERERAASWVLSGEPNLASLPVEGHA